MFMLFLPGLLPVDLAITQTLKTLDIAGALAIIIAIYYIVNLNNIEKTIPFTELIKGMNWSLIFMFATVAPLAAAVSNPEAGILASITAVLNTVFNDTNPYVFTILILFAGSVITQFCNNIAIVLVVVPIMFSFAVQLGANPIVLGVLAAFCLDVAYCTPAASGPAAMIFSNKTWVNTKTAYIHGMIIFVINMLVTIIGLPLCEFLFS